MRSPDTQPFVSHLLELRQRLTWWFASVLVGSVVAYLLHERLVAALIAPLNQPLYFSTPSGGFDFVITLSLVVGTVVSIPVLLFHVLGFLAPALPKGSTAIVWRILLASCLLLGLGMGFAYFVSLPAALHFLTHFSSEEVRSLISTAEYLSFLSRYVLGFGMVFQLPLVLVCLNEVTPLSIPTLIKQLRFVILGSFLVSAILTPTPDVVNQLLLAVPLIALYAVSVVLVWLTQKHAPHHAPLFFHRQPPQKAPHTKRSAA